jgi:CDP-diacylglycerol--serine O-phosphatidyltransferase
LARYNVQAKSAAKGHFVGLPIPAAAEMIAATVLIYYYLGGEGAANKHLTLLLVIYGLALLMVSGFHYLSVKSTDLRKRLPISALVFGLVLIKLAVLAPQVMFFTSFLLYTLSGPLLWCWTLLRRQRGKRGETAKALP